MRTLARDAEIASWKARIEWLQNARELLERLREDSGPAVARRMLTANPRGARHARLRGLRAL
jgi:hypothetical protein